MTVECGNCGNDLEINPVEKPETDWVKVVCSNCGNIENISMIRASSSLKN
jgi:ribosomal protein S27E